MASICFPLLCLFSVVGHLPWSITGAAGETVVMVLQNLSGGGQGYEGQGVEDGGSGVAVGGEGGKESGGSHGRKQPHCDQGCGGIGSGCSDCGSRGGGGSGSG
jgi:hypothetical protein